MKTKDFLSAIVPTDGVLFAATTESFEKDGKSISYFVHEACANPSELSLACKVISSEQKQSYFAMASFKEASYVEESTGKTKQRTQKNVKFLRSMWIDIDCGEKKAASGEGYIDQPTAIKEVLAAIKKAGLPPPTFWVNSGYGIHAYWTFENNIPLDKWQPVANHFTALLSAVGLIADKVSADAARVLRPIGTMNYKKDEGKEVKLIGKVGKVLDYATWAKAVLTASKKFKVKAAKVREEPRLNDALMAGMDEFPPADADRMADKCAFFNHMRETKGADQGEQEWYAALGVLRHVVDADVIATDWSSGHPSFDAATTHAKMQQWGTMGATTCDNIRSTSSQCNGCALKCKSPIVLGFPKIEHQTEVVVEAPVEQNTVLEEGEDAPPPKSTVVESLPQIPADMQGTYAWAEGKGLLVTIEDNDGNSVQVPICSQFPVPEFIFWDDQKEEYKVRVASRSHPFTWVKGDLSMEIVQKGGTGLVGALGAKCALTVRDDNNKHLVRYMKTWVDSIRQSTDLMTMRNSMGWQADGSFLLGHKLYKPNGNHQDIVVSRSLRNYADAHKPKGTKERYLEIVDYLYNKPTYEEYQFVWLASFASILMPLLHPQPQGVTVSLHSEKSGSGKSSTCRAAIANFGDPVGFGQAADGTSGATDYAVTLMLGARRHLPVLIDEVSKWKGDKLGTMLYTVGNGTPRMQGTAEGQLKDTSHLSWNLVAFITSNNPIGSSLLSQGSNAQAQLARMFDLKFRNRGFNTDDALLVDEMLQNSGHTGHEFVAYVVENYDKVQELCFKMLKHLNKKAKATQEGRYWMRLITTVAVASRITKKLGFHGFDVDAIDSWAIQQMQYMKLSADNAIASIEDTMRDLMADMQSGMVITIDAPHGRKETPFVYGVGGPRATITGRYISSTGDIYLPTKLINKWCVEHNIDMREFQHSLEEAKWLIDHSARFSVGAGTPISSTRVRCWHINYEKIGNLLSVIPNGDLEEEPEAAAN